MLTPNSVSHAWARLQILAERVRYLADRARFSTARASKNSSVVSRQMRMPSESLRDCGSRPGRARNRAPSGGRRTQCHPDQQECRIAQCRRCAYGFVRCHRCRTAGGTQQGRGCDLHVRDGGWLSIVGRPTSFRSWTERSRRPSRLVPGCSWSGMSMAMARDLRALSRRTWSRTRPPERARPGTSCGSVRCDRAFPPLKCGRAIISARAQSPIFPCWRCRRCLGTSRLPSSAIRMPRMPGSFTKDTATTLVAASRFTGEWGRAFHVPSQSASVRELVRRFAAALKIDAPGLSRLAPAELEGIGFSEGIEMAYLFEKPLCSMPAIQNCWASPRAVWTPWFATHFRK